MLSYVVVVCCWAFGFGCLLLGLVCYGGFRCGGWCGVWLLLLVSLVPLLVAWAGLAGGCGFGGWLRVAGCECFG